MKTLDLGSFPISESEFSADLQVLVKQIHARYTSRVTIVQILPQGIWTAKKIEELADTERMHIHLTALGVLPIENEGKRGYTIIEPPSHHSIVGKKVVILGAYEPWEFVIAAGTFIRRMRPQSIEIGTIIANGDLPEWVNPDYVVYQLKKTIVVTGLGFGYTPEESAGGSLTGMEVETPQEIPLEVVSGNEVKPEEVKHEDTSA